MNGIIKRAALGLTLAATAVTAAAPADAQRWRGYRRGGGDVATGALIGGVVGLGLGAAIASSNRDRYYRDRYYAPRGYYGPRRGWRGDRGYYAPRGYYGPRGYNRGYDRGYWDGRRYDDYYGGRGYYGW